MIELFTLSGDAIELSSSDVTITLNNSLFNSGEQFKGSASYPIDVAFTPGNLKRLGFANQLDVKVRQVDIPVYARAEGQSFKKCLLNISVNETSFNGFLKLDITAINERIKNTMLTDIAFPRMVLGQTKAEIETAMLAAATNTDWRTIPYTFFPTRNADFGGVATAQAGSSEPNSINFSLINALTFASGAGVFNVEPPTDLNWDGSGGYKHKYQVVPYFYLPYVLTELASWLGFNLKGDFAIHPDVARTVVYNVNATYRTQELPGPGMYFSAHDHLPAISVSDFFKRISSYFCVNIQPNLKQGILNISWKKSVFAKPRYRDWSDKLIKITEQKFIESEGYRISAEVETTTGADEEKDEVLIGYGKEPIEAKAGTLRLTEEQMPDTTANWSIPVDHRAGNVVDDAFHELQNYRPNDERIDFPLRFLINGGVATFGTNPKPYPRGVIAGTQLNLKISGPNGLYEYAHKPWLDKTYATKTIKALFRLTANDLNQLEDEAIIQIPSENGTMVNCLFSSIVFTSKRRQDYVDAEASLIVLDSALIKSVTNDRGVFCKLEFINPNRLTGTEGSFQERRDIRIALFQDRYCTIPLVPVNLVVSIKWTFEFTRIHNYGASDEYTEVTKENRGMRVLMNTSTLMWATGISIDTFTVATVAGGKKLHDTSKLTVKLQTSPEYIIV